MYLDHVDFSHRRIPDSFPRIEVWKLNMIRDYSDLDLKSPSIYGMRPLLDFEKTCYHKVCSLIFLVPLFSFFLYFLFNNFFILRRYVLSQCLLLMILMMFSF